MGLGTSRFDFTRIIYKGFPVIKHEHYAVNTRSIHAILHRISFISAQLPTGGTHCVQNTTVPPIMIGVSNNIWGMQLKKMPLLHIRAGLSFGQRCSHNFQYIKSCLSFESACLSSYLAKLTLLIYLVSSNKHDPDQLLLIYSKSTTYNTKNNTITFPL